MNLIIKYRAAIFYLTVFAFIFLLGACNSVGKKSGNIQPATDTGVYTCPMHPQIIRDEPGNCPICGMALVKKENASREITEVNLSTLLQPTNSVVVSQIPVTTLQRSQQQIDMDVLGRTEYDTRLINTIAARVSGRIEKLYVKYRYQHVHKGDRIMDIYSPELITGQQNLLFLLKNDATNLSLINAAKQRLLLLGMSNQQLQQMISTDKTIYAVTVYSNYMGHIHEAMGMQPNASPQMDVSVQTEELAVKEGMYVTKGQTVFQLFNTDRSWVSLNIYADQAATIKKGTPVTITAETIGDKSFQAQIDFIEPFFRSNTKTITARVYIKNEALQIPIGSQVKATLHVSSSGEWLPQQAVLSLGLNKVVLLKDGSAFKVHPVNTGISANDSIQIVAGLNINDSVASNAQFLMDSESFLKIKQ